MPTKKLPVVNFAKFYENSKLPNREHPSDAGYDCFIHHFVQFLPPEIAGNEKGDMKHYVNAEGVPTVK